MTDADLAATLLVYAGVFLTGAFVARMVELLGGDD